MRDSRLMISPLGEVNERISVIFQTQDAAIAENELPSASLL
jgi:hypothetical protein